MSVMIGDIFRDKNMTNVLYKVLETYERPYLYGGAEQVAKYAEIQYIAEWKWSIYLCVARLDMLPRPSWEKEKKEVWDNNLKNALDLIQSTAEERVQFEGEK